MKVTNLVLTKGVRHEPIGMGKTRRVKCWRYQECRGRSGLLAISRLPETTGEWSVTHVPSGMAVVSGLTLKQAKIAMRELAVLDWPDKEEPTTKDLAPLAPLVAPFRDLSWRRRVG